MIQILPTSLDKIKASDWTLSLTLSDAVLRLISGSTNEQLAKLYPSLFESKMIYIKKWLK